VHKVQDAPGCAAEPVQLDHHQGLGE
jgi:hypothetical protein